jgi:predicted Rossmann fold nucleotide-binding protein DprA/Smf involved in DNA uptake
MEGLLDADNYLVVSQFPPWLPWIGRNAMRRNGTIIGLSDAMILVESGRDGGTFAAGIESLNRHQPLFVVDFEHPGPSAEANPFFIERGGIPIRANRNSRLPNLDRVLEVVRVPRGHNPERALSLF